MSTITETEVRTPTIRPEDLAERIQRGEPVELIDVRTGPEYRELRAKPARLERLDRLDPKAVMNARQAPAEQPLYVICRTGNRGRIACEQFREAGFENVVNVEGGTLAWEKAGLEVVRGPKSVSLERQVRIVAGSLVALGTALGAFVHPGFLAIPAVVGLGLAHAGITDTCGMAMVLAKMPWNR